MYGGDEQGNAYVDDVLAPAAAERGVTLRRVPVADTGDAVNRVLCERQADVTDGEVDLVWINGENFATGQQAGAWLCDWTSMLPNLAVPIPTTRCCRRDFGTAVDGCEAPWHKAQFTLVYDEARVADPPRSVAGAADLGRGPPGPVHLSGPAGLHRLGVPPPGPLRRLRRRGRTCRWTTREERLRRARADAVRHPRRAGAVAVAGGRSYPQTLEELDQLYADGEVDMTMTYGPATLPDLVADGTFPPTTRVLPLDEGTIGNASFLAIPATSGNQAGAMVVADLALSPEQQLAKARPDVWGQYTVLDLAPVAAGRSGPAFDELPADRRCCRPTPSCRRGRRSGGLAAGWVTRPGRRAGDGRSPPGRGRRPDRAGAPLLVLPALVPVGAVVGRSARLDPAAEPRADAAGRGAAPDPGRLARPRRRSGDGGPPLARHRRRRHRHRGRRRPVPGAGRHRRAAPQPAARHPGRLAHHPDPAPGGRGGDRPAAGRRRRPVPAARRRADGAGRRWSAGGGGSPWSPSTPGRSRRSSRSSWPASLATRVASYRETATLLGAGRWARLRHVTLPLAAPALGATAAISFVYTLGSYEVAALLGRGRPRSRCRCWPSGCSPPSTSPPDRRPRRSP